MSKLAWYWRRLRAMEGGELRYRLVQKVRSERDRVRCTLMRRRDDRLWRGLGRSGPPQWDRWWNGDAEPRLRAQDGADFAARYPEEASAIVGYADRIVSGEVMFFDHVPVTIGRRPDWHRDPVSGRLWPANRFYADIGIRWGGAKTAWEAARHQHLTTLAQAYHLTRDERYRNAISDQLESWFVQNKPLRGVHWTSGLEVGIRLISWFWVMEICGTAEFSTTLRRDWTEAVVASGEFLSDHLSAFSSANNHLIGEAAGLFIASVLVPEWHRAAKWRAAAWDVLSREVLLQILPDGTPAEHASHYLGFIVDFFLLVLLVGRRVGMEFSAEAKSRLAAAGAFLAALSDSRGNTFRFGDEDGGVAYLLTQAKDLDVSRRMTLSIVCDDRSLAPRGAGFDPRSWWMLGPAAAERYEINQSDTAPKLDFPDGGYWIIREERADAQLLFDCAPLGYLSIAAHGHADALSIWLSVAGETVLAESGTYKYHEEPEWRGYFRGTAAHNTVRVDGADQSVPTGPTMWGERATARTLLVKREAGLTWIEGEQDGYNRLPSPVVHRRAVATSGGEYFLVIDWLIGEGEHRIERFLHFAPAITIRREANVFYAASSGRRMPVFHGGPADRTCDVVRGSADPILGWNSHQFWQREPSPTLVETWSGKLPRVFATVLGTGASEITSTISETGADALSVVVEGDGWRDEWLCSSASTTFERAAGDQTRIRRVFSAAGS